MNKKVVLPVVIVLVLILLSAFFVFSQKSTKQEPNSTISDTTVQPTAAISQPKSLKDLISLGQAQTCKFTRTDAGNTTAVTVYTSAGKVRGDIQSVTSGQTLNSHLIIEGNVNYMWTDGQNQGYKMTIDPAKVETTTDNKTGINPDEKVDYDCSSWLVDSAKFTLPTDIKFTDFGALTIPQTSPVPGSSGQPDNCAACTYLTGDAKSQCLSALGC